jgi:hypothetical protein
LELNWIRRKSDKSLAMPLVIFDKLDFAGGLYCYPEKKGEFHSTDGKSYSLKDGAILVNTMHDDAESTIAHEWRHHYQYHTGQSIGHSFITLFDKFDYNTALLKYFTLSKTENDALRFQYQYSQIGECWEQILHPLIKDLKVKHVYISLREL